MRAAIIGAGGGIGGALTRLLVADPRFEEVHALARRPVAADGAIPGRVDIEDSDSIAAAAARIGEPLDLLIAATGLLHDDTHGPERSLRDLDAAWLARYFAVNTIGPALVLRHFVPLLPRRGWSAIAMLSARVGSISDNRAGGWYGYRASKAALNMMIRCAAIEIGRTRPDAVCVGLHPGTVATALSQPFQANVPAEKLFSPDVAAGHLLAVVMDLRADRIGRCFGWDGQEIAP